MAQQSRWYGVLTGDIVKSTRLSPGKLEAVRSSLLDAANRAKKWDSRLIRGKPEFFRGDAWQLLVGYPAMALRLAVFLRASLLAGGLADSRVSIGLGEVDAISPKRISLSVGQAFILSGHGVDQMTQYSRMSIEVPKSIGPLADWLRVVGHLCDSIIRRWTQRQAEIVCLAVDPKEPVHEAIARSLRPTVTKQAVTKSLNGADWHVLREAIARFEETRWEAILPASD